MTAPSPPPSAPQPRGHAAARSRARVGARPHAAPRAPSEPRPSLRPGPLHAAPRPPSEPRRAPSPYRRALAAALALILSLETGTAHAAPSERDLAYERGVQAEEAGDHPAAALAFARAYHLTPPGETGPRLLFLRASVGASMRARDGGGDPRQHLCHARALLRQHLADAPPSPGPDPLAEERESLARIERDLGDIDCDAPAPQPVPEDSAPADPAPTDGPTPSPPSPVPEDTSFKQPVPEDISPRAADPRRPLRLAGAASLGLGAAALIPMGVGIALARAATRRGRAACWSAPLACDGSDLDIDDLRKEGQRADRLVQIGAPVAAVALLAGAILLGLGLRGRPRPALTWTPHLGPRHAGVGLQGRF